jgi:hypothetical protein
MVTTLMRLVAKLPDAPGIVDESEKRVTFNNGSVILALHGDEKTLRGHSAVNFLILDESAGIKDELISGLLPMLTVSQGNFWSIGTPRGLRGWFSEAWHATDSEYVRIKVAASDCPRLTESELKRLLKDLGPIQYRQEIGLDFLTRLGCGVCFADHSSLFFVRRETVVCGRLKNACENQNRNN